MYDFIEFVKEHKLVFIIIAIILIIVILGLSNKKDKVEVELPTTSTNEKVVVKTIDESAIDPFIDQYKEEPGELEVEEVF